MSEKAISTAAVRHPSWIADRRGRPLRREGAVYDEKARRSQREREAALHLTLAIALAISGALR